MTPKRAVVTGAAGGLGRAFCVELAQRSGRVVVSDVDEAGGHETVSLVREAGGEAIFVRCDVRDPQAVEALAHEAQPWLGQVDLLVNNAGVAVLGPADEVSLDDWRWIIDINLWGVVHGCRAFLPEMKRRRRGAIINVASAAGLLSLPGGAPYNVTKAGVIALSETLHGELREAGVHVTALCPTFFHTKIHTRGRGVVSEAQRALIEKLMSRSRLNARGVARAALEASEKNRLYTVPMADGRVLWRLKRLFPSRFARLAAANPIYRRAQAR
jgi:NAD(P)-dependent dehydrogenase (short-subunit alcohol dehydrogenase family)